jgi:hypothetical protein
MVERRAGPRPPAARPELQHGDALRAGVQQPVRVPEPGAGPRSRGEPHRHLHQRGRAGDGHLRAGHHGGAVRLRGRHAAHHRRTRPAPGVDQLAVRPGEPAEAHRGGRGDAGLRGPRVLGAGEPPAHHGAAEPGLHRLRRTAPGHGRHRPHLLLGGPPRISRGGEGRAGARDAHLPRGPALAGAGHPRAPRERARGHQHLRRGGTPLQHHRLGHLHRRALRHHALRVGRALRRREPRHHARAASPRGRRPARTPWGACASPTTPPPTRARRGSRRP